MISLIDCIKSEYQRLAEENALNEESIRIHIIINKLLPGLGYSIALCRAEEKVQKGFVDLNVYSDETKAKNLFVEIKAGSLKLDNNHIIQLMQYIAGRPIEYGLLTNGKEYILVNSKIDINNSKISPNNAILGKIIFRFNIFSGKKLEKGYTDLKYLEYLQKDKLFDRETTSYFTDIAQYKAWKHPIDNDSWGEYKSTLLSFFNYYAGKRNIYRLGCLSEINIYDFNEYILSQNKMYSQKTVMNKYRHISSMFQVFLRHNAIKHTDFLGQEEYINIDYSERREKNNYLNAENIDMAIKIFQGLEKRYERLTIFLLCCSYGMERSKIIKLKWEDVDFKKETIFVEGRLLPLNRMLCSFLKELKMQESTNKKRSIYIFPAEKDGQKRHASTNIVNVAFDRLSKAANNEKFDLFTQANIRQWLIERLYEYNYTIDEIVYLTGMDIRNIHNYISYDQIIKKQKISYLKITKRKIFNGILDREVEW